MSASDGGRCLPTIPESCPPGTMAFVGESHCQPVGWNACPPGFEAEPSGWGCIDVQPEAACPAGRMPVLGQRECRPAGWSECPAGFEPDPSGWGCRPVLPDLPCTGATLERLGDRECRALGECAAAFPPLDATQFVDAGLAASQVDDTHFQTISAALVAAPAGAVIAVESGIYSERLEITKPVTVVGRCAQRVVVDGSQVGKSGILNKGVQRVTVRGLTLANHTFGVSLSQGATLSLTESVLTRNLSEGIWVSGAGTAATLSSVAVRDTL
ncbi:MAG: hypothetical protein HY901_15045, partial [Deltaproteobacteria bacterium]|nr:hypothetical protein [Deltaproteobacteria bacterium]